MGQPATRATLEQILPRAQAAKYTEEQIAALTNAELLALRTYQLALRGHPDALKLAWAYTDGKPPEVVEDRGDDARRLALYAVPLRHGRALEPGRRPRAPGQSLSRTYSHIGRAPTGTGGVLRGGEQG